MHAKRYGATTPPDRTISDAIGFCGWHRVVKLEIIPDVRYCPMISECQIDSILDDEKTKWVQRIGSQTKCADRSLGCDKMGMCIQFLLGHDVGPMGT